MKKAILFVAFAAVCGAQTTVNGGRDYKGTLKASGSVSAVDFSGAGGTAPVKAGTLAARPTGCTQGQIYFATDVTAGQNLSFCTATGAPGVWTAMTGGDGGTATAGAGEPGGSCAPPALYVDTTNQDLWFCGTTNSWKKPTADTSGLPTLTGANTFTGYSDLAGGQWRPPESTVANLPPASGNAGKVFMVTDAVTAGSCLAGGGMLRELCRATGSTYECVGGCGSGSGGGGSGSTAFISPLISGPDSTKIISGATHGFATPALIVAVYDSSSPRKAITAGWSVAPSTYDVTIEFASPQTDYYVVINGGVGATGPAGPTVYPAVGVPSSTGTAWGTSYTAGTAANNLVQLNESGQLPAVSAALLTNFPTFNQSTTGTAAGISGGSSGQVAFQTGTGATGFSSDLTYDDTTKAVSSSGGFTAGLAGAATGTYNINGATSGTVTITGASTAGTWSMTLPTNGGSAGQFLQTNGSGGTSWATVSGTGITSMTAGASDPVAACPAPSASNLTLYAQTTTQDLWACVATNTWKKVLSTTNTGPYTQTGGTGSAPSRPASGDLACYYDNIDNMSICLDEGTQVAVMVKSTAARTANQFVTHIDTHGVAQKAAIAAADVPTLNQNTTGTAANLSGTPALPNGTTATTQSPADNTTKLATTAYADAAAAAKTGTIASGAKALATTPIPSAACSAAQTDTATGTTTADVVTASFSGDPTAVTGYIPLTTGSLSIIVYPTANAVNFKVCNNTAAEITPGAVTINWRVVR